MFGIRASEFLCLSRCVPTSQHAEQFAPCSSQSAVFVGGVKRQRTSNRAQSWSLVLPQNEMTWTRTLYGCRFQVAHVRWRLHVGVCCWRLRKTSSLGRRIEASCRSVHEREPRFISRDQQNVEERRAHLHASLDGQICPSKVVRLFAHGAGAGLSCTPKVSLCDATICVVVADFLWPLCSEAGVRAHATSHKYLDALDVMLQKSSNAWSASKRCSWHSQAA